MSKNHSISIDFDKLNNIPYIKQFDTKLFEQEVYQAISDWEQYEEYYEYIALIRAMECTNGCVQYSYRNNDEDALSLEQTKECMNLSMGFILSKELTLPNGEHIKIPFDLIPQLNKIRQLYYNGFKKQNHDDLRSFYANSVAMFNLLGEEHILKAMNTIKTHYKDVFTPHFLFYGLNYQLQFLEVTDSQTDEEIYEKNKKIYLDFYEYM